MTLFQSERASYCRLILIMGVSSCFVMIIHLLGLCFGVVIGTRSLTNDVGWATLGHDLEQSISGRTTRSQLEEIFKNVNKIRPIGSLEHEQVRQYIKTYLSARNWTVELDSFTEDTVIGEKTFHNIIADIGTPKPRRLILACHYESLSKEGFYGSIDSAMPCSIILKLADILSVALLRQKNFDVGLQLVFFDGEEAFVDWSDTDSIYGARHLVKKWSEAPTPVGDETLLSSIDLLILLDLLGSRVGGIPNYKLAPDEYYNKLFECEQSMRSHRLLRSTASRGQTYFGHTAYGVIQDDHIPFIKKGVKVLHLIPQEFPSFWHTTGDNDSIIDWKVSLDTLNVIEAYVRSYLHLIE